MKKIIILFTIISFGLLSLMTQEDKGTIIIYASSEQFRNDELQKQLHEKFPELNIRVMYSPTSKTAARVAVEKEKVDADIILAIDTSYLNSIKDSFADISEFTDVDYMEGLDTENFDNKFVIWERYAGAIIVNPEVLDRLGLEAPKSYEDLLDPKYAGLVTMPDPNSSGTGYFFLLNLVNEMGEDAAFEYFDKLQANIKQFTESGSGPIKLLVQGEAAIALGMTFQAVNTINDGIPLDIYFPQEGSPFSVSGSALIKGRENNPDIVRVFEFIVNDFIMYDKEHFSPELIFDGQEIVVPNYPKNIQYADMKGIEDLELKVELLKRWKY